MTNPTTSTARVRREKILKTFNALPKEIQDYFEDMNLLLLNKEIPASVLLAYVFFMIEQGQTELIYFGARKIHRTAKDLSRKIIFKQHMTREAFLRFFKTIYAKEIPEKIVKTLESAEAIRDKVMHGKDKGMRESERNRAILSVFSYAQEMNKFFAQENFGIIPYGSNKGRMGRAKPCDASTTRWILIGMGFSVS